MSKSTYSFSIFWRNLTRPFVALIKKARKNSRVQAFVKRLVLFLIVAGLLGASAGVLWLSTLKIPDLQSFDRRLLSESTKIYDKNDVLLYNVNQDIKRTVVPYEEISPYLKQATIAIEDADFYKHSGIKISSIFRAIWVDIKDRSLSQGGSTITQQVIKNSLLTTDKKISRKIKEWVLALKLERVMNKDSILNLYMNGTPYGGPMYGVEEASMAFFGVHAKDVNLAQAAYIAALPQAPTYYSPYGKHTDDLEKRKNLVLDKMHENGMISADEVAQAKAEKVIWKPQQNQSIKAPHFVNFVMEYLEEKYGQEAVLNGGLKVITTLDYELQSLAEDTVKKYAADNVKKFNASNAAMVAVDPKTGGILVMVGSKDYFSKEIQGNFNVTTAARQPGSSFKPFVYAAAFNKGYEPETVLFDVPTEFSTRCPVAVDLNNEDKNCYHPQNYDDSFRGPISIRSALAQSINIPAVKTLYLVGVNNAIRLAKDMGIQGLSTKSQYGLTLVLGGGEVTPLDMASAYSVFANDGLKNPQTAILKIEDRDGNILEEYKENSTRVLPEQTARKISSILSDPKARFPSYSATSPLNFYDRDVAAKTGTTNDSRDAWIVGYTPYITVAAWAGNNDNSPMVKNVAGYIVAPMWRAFMDEVLKKLPEVEFTEPEPVNLELKPILRGVWQGGGTFSIDSRTGQPASELTPPEYRQEMYSPNVHSILYWVDKDDPTGPAPSNPYKDSQYSYWEYGVQKWLAGQNAAQQNIVPQPAVTPPPVLIEEDPPFPMPPLIDN